MKKILQAGVISVMSVTPLAVFAAQASTIQDVLKNLTPVLQLATSLAVSLALLGFFWGLAMYVFGTSNDDKRKKGVSAMVWGIVALFVMLSIFGIINALQSTAGVGSGTITIPTIK